MYVFMFDCEAFPRLAGTYSSEGELLTPRLRQEMAAQVRTAPWDPRLLQSTSRLAYKPVDRNEAAAARGIGADHHKTKGELTEYVEEVLRHRQLESFYSTPRSSNQRVK